MFYRQLSKIIASIVDVFILITRDKGGRCIGEALRKPLVSERRDGWDWRGEMDGMAAEREGVV